VRHNIPIHALNEYLHNLVTGISNLSQFVQTRTSFSGINSPVDDFIDAVPKTRKMSCSFQVKGNYLLKILSNLDNSTIELYMARKHSP
jgi:hypothetical protein